jgi:Tol biopolymer transport system component
LKRIAFVAPLALFWPGLAAADVPPRVFAPGVVSELVADSSPSFFPGNVALIFEHADQRGATLRISTRTGTGWSAPTAAPFSGIWNDLEPAVASDGKSVVFVSSRPESGRGPQLTGHWGGEEHPDAGGNLWQVDRVGAGWSAPRRLPDVVNSNDAVFAPTLAADGTLYFMRTDAVTGKFRLFEAAREGGRYRAVRPLPFSTGEVADCDPAVAPDKSFLIFTSARETPGQLKMFIAFNRGGAWTKPLRLPDSVNSAAAIKDPHINADRTMLYFSHDRVIWEVPLAPIVDWARSNIRAS